MEKFLSDLEANLSGINFMAFFSASEIASSLLLIAIVMFARRLLIRYVRKDAEILAKEQRRWIIRIKNTSAAIIFICLILIWAPQLHTFALSASALPFCLIL